MLIDTHTHLYLEEFQPTSAEVVLRAIEAGVEKMVFPNVDLSTITPMKELCAKFPNNCYMAMGLHPTEVKESWKKDLAIIEAELKNETNYIAIGEVGIDLYWDKTFCEEQKIVLKQQMQWALELNRPVILHCREGLNEILEVIDSLGGAIPKCVFHSFGGTIDDVARIRERGDFYFGINGIVTFKNSKLREVLSVIGVNRILLETDSPYLAPVPHRGHRNESAYIIHIAAYIANVLGLSLDKLQNITTDNAKNFFGI